MGPHRANSVGPDPVIKPGALPADKKGDVRRCDPAGGAPSAVTDSVRSGATIRRLQPREDPSVDAATPSTVVGPSVADRSKAYCSQLLERAVRAVDGRAGAVFLLDGPRRLGLVVNHKVRRGDELKKLERAALSGLGDRRTSLVRVAPPSRSTRAGSTSVGLLVAPALLDGAVVAIVVLVGTGRADLSLEECGRRLEPILFPIALSVERLRMHGALEQRGEEIAALRQQLDAYAVDFRSTYLAERDRSQQLAAALGELEETYKSTVRGLAIAVEAKDECTGGHLQRVSRYGMMLTALVAPEHATDPQFEYGFLLHDIGKLIVPDLVLQKAGPLTDSEWELMREHPESGRRILDGIPFLAGASKIIHAHHEHWDGSGYPLGLKGEEIPLGAQIFPLCDAFDAMTSDRPYRSALPIEASRSEVRRCSGTQFWPDAVDAFLSLSTEELAGIRAAGQAGVP